MQDVLIKRHEVKGLMEQINFLVKTQRGVERKEAGGREKSFYQTVNRVDAMALTEIKAEQYTGIPAQQSN